MRVDLKARPHKHKVSTYIYGLSHSAIFTDLELPLSSNARSYASLFRNLIDIVTLICDFQFFI